MLRLLKKMLKRLFSFLRIRKKFFGTLAIVVLPLSFFWKFFIKGLIPVPADIIVGMYYPFRNYIWGGFVAGVPFKNGLISDVVSQLYPWRLLASWQWLSGHIPLWNPYILGGMPLAANVQSAVFYPLNFIFFLHPNGFTWGITIILQSALAFYFMYLFLREIRLSALIAVFGALAFAFNGFFLFWLEWGNLVAVACWLPLLLWAIEKMAKNKRKWFKYWLVFILAMAMSILAGHFQMAFYVGVTALVYGLIKGKRMLLLVITGGLLALLLTSFQILPAFEAYHLSIRDTEGIMEQYNYGFLRPANLITLIAPDFFGNPGTGNWSGFGKGIELTPYVGLVTLFFFLFSLLGFRKHWKSRLFKASLVILFISLVFLIRNPFSLFFYQRMRVPGLTSSPANRMIVLLNFSIILGALIGLNDFISNDLGVKKIWKTFLFLGAALFLLWGVTIYSLRVGGVNLVSGANPDFWHVASRNLILPTLIWVFLGLLFLSGYLLKLVRLRLRREVFLLAIIFLLGFELFHEGWKFNSFSQGDWLFPSIPEIEYLQKKAGINRVEGAILPDMKMPYGIQSVSGYEILIPKRTAEFIAACNLGSGEGVKRPLGRYVSLKKPSSRCGHLYGVRYFLGTKHGVDRNERSLRGSKDILLIEKNGRSGVFLIEKALPRFFLVDSFDIFRDPVTITDRLVWDENFILGKKVILEEKAPKLKEADKPLNATAKLLGYQPNEVSFFTESNKNALLFLSDNYYPGWQALVDGQRAKLYRADYTFRAVFVPKGRHRVEFIYRPRSFKIGVLILGVTTLFSAGLFLVFKKLNKI